MSIRWPGALALVFGTSLGMAGCGRSATREDCEAMLRKHIEVKLADESNVALRAQKTAEYTQMLKPQVDACVGRKLTDAYLNCVKNAANLDALRACRKE